MESDVLNIFLKPYPPIVTDNQRWLKISGISLAIIIFLSVFQPFGLKRVVAYRGYSFLIGYGVVTFLTLTVFLRLIPSFRFIPSFFNANNWKVWKHITWVLLTVLFIGFLNLIYTMLFLEEFSLTIWDWILFELYTLSIAIIPVGFITLIRHNRLLKKHVQSATEIGNGVYEHGLFTSDDSIPFTLQGQNNDEVLTLKSSELRYITSEGNYVRVVYYNNGILKQELLRNTLKNILNQLEDDKWLFRCHRSYIVNAAYIENADGNAQGLQLSISDCDEKIPVSRNYIDVVQNALKYQS